MSKRRGKKEKGVVPVCADCGVKKTRYFELRKQPDGGFRRDRASDESYICKNPGCRDKKLEVLEDEENVTSEETA